jgi:hypothetical protein
MLTKNLANLKQYFSYISESESSPLSASASSPSSAFASLNTKSRQKES